MTVHAFNYAEEFRCPVFIASNKEIGMTRESVDLDAIKLPPLVERTPFTGEKYLPFEADPDKAPAFLPVGGRVLVRQTSSTHGPDGYITIDPDTISASQKRLQNKILAAEELISLFEETGREGADTLVISYGVSSRAVNDACAHLAERGKPVSTLTLKTVWPVPEKLIKERAAQYKRVVVIEMNLGQYVNEIRRVLTGKTVDFYGQMDGTLIAPGKIMEVIENE